MVGVVKVSSKIAIFDAQLRKVITKEIEATPLALQEELLGEYRVIHQIKELSDNRIDLCVSTNGNLVRLPPSGIILEDKIGSYGLDYIKTAKGTLIEEVDLNTNKSLSTYTEDANKSGLVEVLVGNMLFTFLDDNGSPIGLTEEQIAFVEDICSTPETYLYHDQLLPLMVTF